MINTNSIHDVQGRPPFIKSISDVYCFYRRNHSHVAIGELIKEWDVHESIDITIANKRCNILKNGDGLFILYTIINGTKVVTNELTSNDLYQIIKEPDIIVQAYKKLIKNRQRKQHCKEQESKVNAMKNIKETVKTDLIEIIAYFKTSRNNTTASSEEEKNNIVKAYFESGAHTVDVAFTKRTSYTNNIFQFYYRTPDDNDWVQYITKLKKYSDIVAEIKSNMLYGTHIKIVETFNGVDHIKTTVAEHLK